MAFLDIPNIVVQGISACVPAHKADYEDFKHLFTEKEYHQFVEATGISGGRLPEAGTCASDLCYKAAERLINDLKIDKDKIDILIFVSQTPDYIVPMTSCLLQERLGLSKECMALDITAGCSGYVYGMSIIASLLSGKGLKQGLLLVGDCLTSQISPLDKSTYPLFGAAGTATLLRFSEGVSGLKFHLATDGSGAEAIMIKAGGNRYPASSESFIMKEVSPGIIRNDMNTILNGMDVFSFAIAEAPDTIEKLYTHFGLDIETTDYFVFHQANKMIQDMICSSLNLSNWKAPSSLKDFANTSSASIPLTIVTDIGTIKRDTIFCLCGFGVGLSWGSCYFKTSKLFCSKLIEYA